MNTLHLSDDGTVELHIQTNNSTKHLNKTGEKIEEEKNQVNCSHDSPEKRNCIAKNDNEKKEFNKRKTKHPILPLCCCKKQCIE